MVLRNGSKDSFLFFVFIHFSKKHTANKNVFACPALSFRYICIILDAVRHTQYKTKMFSLASALIFHYIFII